MSEIRVEANTDRVVYKISDLDVYIFKSPFSNCQTYSIAGIDTIMSRDNKIEILKAIQSRAQKTQLACDISQKWLSKLEEIFLKEDFIIKQPYKNETGSPMVMCLIKTKKIR